MTGLDTTNSPVVGGLPGLGMDFIRSRGPSDSDNPADSQVCSSQ